MFGIKAKLSEAKEARELQEAKEAGEMKAARKARELEARLELEGAKEAATQVGRMVKKNVARKPKKQKQQVEQHQEGGSKTMQVAMQQLKYKMH